MQIKRKAQEGVTLGFKKVLLFQEFNRKERISMTTDLLNNQKQTAVKLSFRVI